MFIMTKLKCQDTLVVSLQAYERCGDFFCERVIAAFSSLGSIECSSNEFKLLANSSITKIQLNIERFDSFDSSHLSSFALNELIDFATTMSLEYLVSFITQVNDLRAAKKK
ncbi:hypothetical protein BpHYR1_027390, partial [Brachionus plicatilis]